MTLYHEPRPRFGGGIRRPRASRTTAGMGMGIIFLCLLLAMMFMPTAYLYQTTGPAVPVSGELSGTEVIQLTNTDEQEYPSDSVFMMTTVSTFGTADESVVGAAALQGLVDDQKDLIPVRALYGADVHAEDVRAFNKMLMESSQTDAVVAGFTAAGVDLSVSVEVAGFSEGSNAEGVLAQGDVITAMSFEADTIRPQSVLQMREFLEDVEPGESVHVEYTRDGTSHEADITTMVRPDSDPGEGSLLGVQLYTSLHEGSPNATITVGDIGGPSAGQMFALEIYDKLTEGSLAGDAVVAGTGTIDIAGSVGPIGGIRHKMVGARQAGAEYFLAPLDNCDEVVGYEPEGLTVFAVSTLDESIAAMEAVASGDVSDVPRCPAQ